MFPTIPEPWRMEQHSEEIEAFHDWLEGYFDEWGFVTAIELGVRHGGTSALWCASLCFDIVIGIDRKGHDSYREPEFSDRAALMMKQYPNYRFIEGDSQMPDTVTTARKYTRSKIGFLFIDADHSYAGVKRDYELWTPLLCPRAVIAFHDIVDGPRTGGGVTRFFEELPHVGKTRFLKKPAADWGGIGVVIHEGRTA